MAGRSCRALLLYRAPKPGRPVNQLDDLCASCYMSGRDTTFSERSVGARRVGGAARDCSWGEVSPRQGDQVNTRTRSTLRILLTMAALGALGALSAAAQPVPLFSDDFGPKPLAGWQASPLGLATNWDASSGAAAYNGGGHTQLYAGSAAWTDYKVEAKIRLANGNNYPAGLRGRVSTSTGESYAAWIYPSDGVVKLFRVVAWHIDTTGLQLLAQANVGTITPGVFH